MLIDTHAHLWFDSFASDLPEVLARAKAAGVEKIIVPGTAIESSRRAIELAQKYPEVIYAAVGIHPEDVVGADVDQVYRLTQEHKKCVVAVGEIGIDLHEEKEKKSLDAQKVLFKTQCELAIGLDLPVIIHTRDSFAVTWEVLTTLSQMPRGQFHCFSVDPEALKTVLDAGFYVSFCGNIAWSKRVAGLVPRVPDERLLLETDSPFMNPGQRNEPAYVAELAVKVGELRGQKVEEVARITTENAKRLFHL